MKTADMNTTTENSQSAATTPAIVRNMLDTLYEAMLSSNPLMASTLLPNQTTDTSGREMQPTTALAELPVVKKYKIEIRNLEDADQPYCILDVSVDLSEAISEYGLSQTQIEQLRTRLMHTLKDAELQLFGTSKQGGSLEVFAGNEVTDKPAEDVESKEPTTSYIDGIELVDTHDAKMFGFIVLVFAYELSEIKRDLELLIESIINRSINQIKHSSSSTKPALTFLHTSKGKAQPAKSVTVDDAAPITETVEDPLRKVDASTGALKTLRKPTKRERG